MSGDRARGYALPEVLIASLIAAGVIAAAATSINSSVRLSRASETRAGLLLEAQTIAARLSAGVPDRDIERAFTDWKITRTPLAPSASEQPPIFDRIDIHCTVNHRLSFSVIGSQQPFGAS